MLSGILDACPSRVLWVPRVPGCVLEGMWPMPAEVSGRRLTFLRGECKMEASCLAEEKLGSVPEADALCEIDFPVPWKYMAAPREASEALVLL